MKIIEDQHFRPSTFLSSRIPHRVHHFAVTVICRLWALFTCFFAGCSSKAIFSSINCYSNYFHNRSSSSKGVFICEWKSAFQIYKLKGLHALHNKVADGPFHFEGQHIVQLKRWVQDDPTGHSSINFSQYSRYFSILGSEHTTSPFLCSSFWSRKRQTYFLLSKILLGILQRNKCS